MESGINGNNLKLYYVENESNIKELGTVVVNSNGSVTVRFSHASYYIISEKEPMLLTDIDTPEKVLPPNINKEGSFLRTGLLIFIIIAILVGSGLVAFTAMRIRKKE